MAVSAGRAASLDATVTTDVLGDHERAARRQRRRGGDVRVGEWVLGCDERGRLVAVHPSGVRQVVAVPGGDNVSEGVADV